MDLWPARADIVTAPRYVLGLHLLKGREPYRVPDDRLEFWAISLGKQRRVARTTRDRVEVSTVFLGLDSNSLRRGPPLLFETMIFDDARDGHRPRDYQTRCATYAQALTMHSDALRVAFGPDYAVERALRDALKH